MTVMKRVVLSLGLAFVLAPLEATAGGNLMVHPTRIVFEGRDRTAQIDVINDGDEERTYRIAVVRRRMTETGEFVRVETPEPGEQFADEMIRFSPRQVTLPAGGGQIVRLQLRKPANLPAGEYRSHLYFQALPTTRPPAAQPTGITPANDLKIELTAIVSLSIPVIVRQGETSASLKFTDTRFEPAGQHGDELPSLLVGLEREGNRSVYGDITVYFTPRGGRELVVGRANGVAVYVPNRLRRARVPLRVPAGQSLANGRLRVAFTDRPESGGNILADAQLDLP